MVTVKVVDEQGLARGFMMNLLLEEFQLLIASDEGAGWGLVELEEG